MLLFSKCHVDKICCNFCVELSRSKPSVNEHMIQICLFGLVFSPSCFYAHRIFTALSLSSWIEYGTNRVRCGTHAAGKLLWFFHLDTHLLLIKLKLDGNYCWLFWYGFRHKSLTTGYFICKTQQFHNATETHNYGNMAGIHMSPWFNIIIGHSYSHFTHTKFFHMSIWWVSCHPHLWTIYRIKLRFVLAFSVI